MDKLTESDKDLLKSDRPGCR